MENQILSFQEEVEITRKQVITAEHGVLLVWGWTTLIVAFAVFLSVWSTGNRLWEYLWLAQPVVGGLISLVKGKPRLISPTSLYKMMTLVSRIMIGTIVICAAAAFCTVFNVWFFILVILSLWNGVSAYMLDYPRLRISCFGGLAISFFLLFASETYVVPIFASGIVFTLIVPGYVMRSDYIKQHLLKSYISEL